MSSEQTVVPATNDPWSPIDEHTDRIPTLSSLPRDPVKHIISTERYLESLETKLSRIKGKQNKPVTASEMIETLTQAKEDQMVRFLASDTFMTCMETDLTLDNDPSTFSIQRILNPEKQAINPQELVPLVHNDILAKTVEETLAET